MSAGVTHEATGVSHEATGRAWQRGRALTSRTQMLGTKNSRNRFRFFIASWRLRDLTWGQNDESRNRFSITRFLLEQALDSSCKISCLRLLSQTICHRVIVSRFREYWKSRNRKVANSSPYVKNRQWSFLSEIRTQGSWVICTNYKVSPSQADRNEQKWCGYESINFLTDLHKVKAFFLYQFGELIN